MSCVHIFQAVSYPQEHLRNVTKYFPPKQMVSGNFHVGPRTARLGDRWRNKLPRSRAFGAHSSCRRPVQTQQAGAVTRTASCLRGPSTRTTAWRVLSSLLRAYGPPINSASFPPGVRTRCTGWMWALMSPGDGGNNHVMTAQRAPGDNGEEVPGSQRQS